jgi:hypothetical protein
LPGAGSEAEAPFLLRDSQPVSREDSRPVGARDGTWPHQRNVQDYQYQESSQRAGFSQFLRTFEGGQNQGREGLSLPASER